MKDYPTVTLQLGRRLRTFHFDTGSSVCWVRAADLREHGVALDVTDRRMVRGMRGRYYSYSVEEPVQCTLHDQETQGTIAVLIRGIAIEDFSLWEFARFCGDSGCPHGYLTPNGECVVRAGLVGRSLLHDNQLSITISALKEATNVRQLKS